MASNEDDDSSSFCNFQVSLDNPLPKSRNNSTLQHKVCKTGSKESDNSFKTTDSQQTPTIARSRLPSSSVNEGSVNPNYTSMHILTPSEEPSLKNEANKASQTGNLLETKTRPDRLLSLNGGQDSGLSESTPHELSSPQMFAISPSTGQITPQEASRKLKQPKLTSEKIVRYSSVAPTKENIEKATTCCICYKDQMFARAGSCGFLNCYDSPNVEIFCPYTEEVLVVPENKLEHEHELHQIKDQAKKISLLEFKVRSKLQEWHLSRGNAITDLFCLKLTELTEDPSGTLLVFNNNLFAKEDSFWFHEETHSDKKAKRTKITLLCPFTGTTEEITIKSSKQSKSIKKQIHDSGDNRAVKTFKKFKQESLKAAEVQLKAKGLNFKIM